MSVFLVFLALAIFLLVRVKTALTYFQQEEYDYPRFFRTGLRVGLIDILASAALIILWLAGFGTIALLLFFAALGFIAYRERNHVYKKPLVFTTRAKRIFRLAWVFAVVDLLIVFIHPLLALFVLQLVPVLVVVADQLIKPIQKKENDAFIAEAKAKMAGHDGTKIAITGSFGKTSVKHILAHMLERKFRVFYSKGSINTVLGITRHVRQRLQAGHDVMIFEMGAYGIGSIQRLCDFANPDHAIVTSIGDAHAERFGNIETTARAKSELPLWVLPKGGITVMPTSLMNLSTFEKIRSDYPDTSILVGEERASDYLISHIRPGADGFRYDLSSKRFKLTKTEIFVPLLGSHNVMNTALVLALSHNLYGEVEFAKLAAESMLPTAHRLDVSDLANGATLIDDAYNSNEDGFKGAVGALNLIAEEKDGKRILVTPGLAELGDKHDAVHQRLGELSGTETDVVCVVNPSRIPTFVDAAKNGTADLLTFDSFTDAKAYFDKNTDENDVVLLENDLPDILEQEFRIH